LVLKNDPAKLPMV